MSSVTGRLYSGGSVVVDLVLFEVAKGHLLDKGVPSALITHFISQYKPSSVSCLKSGSEWSDFIFPSNGQVQVATVQDGGSSTKELELWELVRNACTESGAHLVLLDTLDVLIERHKLGALTRLMYGARKANARVAFAAMVFGDSLDSKTTYALRSLGSVHVEVRQTNGTTSGAIGTALDVWDCVTLRICRRKSSGRVNMESVSTKFDATKNILTEVVSENRSGVNDTDGHAGNSAEDERLSRALNLSFIVQLTAEEKAARSAVKLPFVHQEARVADQGLVLHPEELQVKSDNVSLRENNSLSAEDTSESGSTDEDEAFLGSDAEEELFSEDV